jgi:hypothetical protein
MKSEIDSRRWKAFNDIRTALAEGDLSSILLTDDGHETPISITKWRSHNGLTGVATGRVSVQFPHSAHMSSGQALIKEAHFNDWMKSTLGPEPDFENSSPRKQAIATTAATIGKEKRLKDWLMQEMQARPEAPISKSEMQQKAIACGYRSSVRGFERAWATALRESGATKWSAPGRKSRRRIDTEN